MPSSAFIVGYTGETGKLLVRELLTRKLHDRVVLIGRRAHEGELPSGAEFRQVDFDNLDNHAQDFAGFDQAFCCLGAWISKQGRETFVKIDRDATIKIAQLAKAGGAQHFHLISSGGTSSNSMNFYLRTKHQAEEGVIAAGFNRVSIYQPGFIIANRPEEAPGVKFIKPLFKLSDRLFPTLMTTKATDIARAMASRSVLEKSEPEPEVLRLNIAEILKWSKKLDAESPSPSTKP